MTRRSTRRDFLKQSALAGVGFWVAGSNLSAASKSANEQVNIACIGVGGKGSSDCDNAGEYGNIVALCDVDETFLEKKAQKFPKAKKYFDFRKMLDEMGTSIDAVTVSTPDNTHAVASIMAMKMGKHVYCQKPLTHDIYEARQMRETAAKMNVATQMGNQGSASDGLRRAVELVEGGAIGAVHEVHVWTNRPVWPQAPKIVARPPEDPVPAYLHWDEWIGPAPMRPYSQGGNKGHRGAYHDFNWRGWWDFGTGALGDMGCHTANLAFRALKLHSPVTIAAESAEVNPETYPAWARVTYQFPAHKGRPQVKLVWHEGHKDGKTVVPSSDLVKGLRETDNGASIYFKDDQWHVRTGKGKGKAVSSGSFLIGDKATLFSPDDYGGEAYIITADSIEKVTGKPEKLASNNKGDSGQKGEWVQAIRGGPKAYSNFDFAALLTETLLLGNIAVALGKKLEWNHENMQATNCPEADKYIRREYRKGWSL